MLLQELLARLQQHPDLLIRSSLEDVARFVRLATLAKPAIQFQLLDISEPPSRLPLHAHTFLSAALGLDWGIVHRCWMVLGEMAWHSTDVAATKEDIQAFREQGLPQGIGFRDMYPPTRVCLNPACVNHRSANTISTLREGSRFEATLFTIGEGTLPIFSNSLYCHKCLTRYHPNYCVNKASSTRTYYHGVPNIIQVSQRHYFERALLELHASEMCFAWESSTNCVRVYNKSLATLNTHLDNDDLGFNTPLAPMELPLNWHSSLQMNNADVLNGFFLYSLLLEHAERNQPLVFPHDATAQKLRLEPLLEERNTAMEGFGQEYYTHACDLCCLVYEDNNGILVKMQGAVTDGITMGHPCCGEHDCKIPLANSNRDHFCPVHLGLELQCVVTTCTLPHSQGFRTCEEPTHRQLETAYQAQGMAFFQMQAKIKGRHTGVSHDSVPLTTGEDDNAVFVEGNDTVEGLPVLLDCDGKSPQGNRRVRARFGRRRTHNEQLMIRPCGVIVSRASFFGSEAISAVRDFTLATFPTPEAMPECFWYDTNCGLLKHLRKIGCRRFEKTAVVVDVFHFNTKHKESDGVCQEYCNPALFPELYKDGQWVFNSSIAEQTNVWYGGFQAIVREMGAVRFNFYLDEMIKRRNRHVVAELERKGHHPWLIPMEALFPEGTPSK